MKPTELTDELSTAVFEQLLQRRAPAAARPTIPRQPRGGSFPLSHAQERMWLLEHFVGHGLYHVPDGYRIRGALDVAALERALAALVARHDILRARFSGTDGAPVQVIADHQHVAIRRVDLSMLAADRREPRAQAEALDDARRPFDFAAGPLLRVTLMRLAADDHLLAFTFHHIIYDGASSAVMIRELAQLYEHEVSGARTALPELAIQYVDFAVWQRQHLQGERLERELDHWRKALAGLPILELPLDHPRPASETYEGAAESVTIAPAVRAALDSLAREEGCTLFMVLLAAFDVVLCQHTGQTDFAVGTVVSHRGERATEELLGCFVNTLAVRADLDGHPSFRELVRRVRDASLDAFAHQDVAFQQLVDALQPERDLNRPPLFQVFFALQNATLGAEPPRGLAFSRWKIRTEKIKFDLSLEAVNGPDGLSLELAYSAALFEPITIRRMMAHLEAVLAGAVADPDHRVRSRAWLTADEREIIAGWNATAAAFPRDPCVHDLIAAQAAASPDRVALELEGVALTYRELDAQASQLAHHLAGLGAGPGTLVGICLPRSHELVRVALAIWKTGAAYVPLDPDYPADRLGYMIGDAQVPLVVCVTSTLPRLAGASAHEVCLDRDRAAIEGAPAHPLPARLDPEERAYVLYTSGSTGRPKGVEIPHRSLVNLFHAMRQAPGITADDTIVAITTQSFDISGIELYLPLTVGARIVVVPRDVVQAAELLRDKLEASGATVVQATPTTWRMLIDAGWRGGPHLKVMCGGEAFTRELAAELRERCASLWNMYGPTEVTIWASTAPVTAAPGPISLGRPIHNLQAYVLGPAQQLVPLGAPGELYLGGAGVGRGYLRRPALTAERFVPDPFGGRRGARLYRTGDLVRMHHGGALEFLGRLDHQTKIRGHRIELGEIEALLAEHPAVSACVVIVREDLPGDRRLVAYLVARAGEPPSDAALKALLKARLPDYMVPWAFVTLAALPVTPNGKLDRRALPAPALAASSAYLAPRTPDEAALAGIYADVLGIAQVGIDASFFDLGGDSLTVIRVVARAKKQGLAITSRQVFKHPRIIELAQVIGTVAVLAEQGESTGQVSFTTSMRWWMEQLGADLLRRQRYYSIAFTLEGREPLDLEIAKDAIRGLVRHHDALRLVLRDHPAGWRLEATPYTDVAFDRIDVSHVPETEQDAVIKDRTRDFQTAFDLERGPLFKVAIVDRGPGRPVRLLLACHYVPADLESWHVFLGDLDTTYASLRRGEPFALPPKGTSYRQWSERMLGYAQSAELRAEVDYWTAERWHRMPSLPVDFPGGSNDLLTCDVVVEALSEADTTALTKQVLRGADVLIDSALLVAVVDAMEPWTGTRALGINQIGNGRQPLFDDVDLSRTVGWLSVISPCLVELGAISDPERAIRTVNDQLRAIPKWGIGYGILRYLCPDPEIAARLQRIPTPELFFNYTGDKKIEYEQFRAVGMTGGYFHDPEATRPYLLAIYGSITEGKLELRWEYSPNLHRRETVARVARATMDSLRGMIARHVASKGGPR